MGYITCDRSQVRFAALFLLLILSACVGDADITSHAWIDSPLPNHTYVLGEPIPIAGHFFSKDGIETYRIEVDGKTLKDSSITQIKDNFREVSRDWIPDEIGDHVIVVVALDDEEHVIDKAKVSVRVIDKLLGPDLVVTAIQISPIGEVICDYANVGLVGVHGADEVHIKVSIGTSEEILVNSGTCNLSVDSPYAPHSPRIAEDFESGMTGQYFSWPLSDLFNHDWPRYVSCFIDYENLIGETNENNNEIVVLLSPGQSFTPMTGITSTATETPEMTETPQISPTFTPTTTLTPRPTTTSTPSPTNTIRVDDVPPIISNMTTSDDPIYESPCQPDSVRISVEVFDSSGLQNVKLYYRISNNSQTGEWRDLNMQSVDVRNYQITLGPSEFSASMSAYVGRNLQYYVKAWDNVGNVAETTSEDVDINSCVQ